MALKQYNYSGDWIVVNPFNNNESNLLIKNATNYTATKIVGLIFVSD